MELSKEPNIQAFNVDCMEFMKDKPDNYYDLAIVDPPYGIGMDGGKVGAGKMQQKKDWDSAPPNSQYFAELMRVSVNQIIWGANYFVDNLKPSMGWIYWDKLQNKNGHRYGKTFSSGELAYTSFNRAMEHFEYKYQGNYIGHPDSITTKTSMRHELKIHPTQKPIALYRWLLKNYAKEGDKILDTHGGSFSSAIACHMEGFDLDICELDEDYFNDAVKRFKLNTVQGRLF